MENAEVDVALEELENRLERLRALYEQYFMGIERIEPQIPRKDVDRRIYVLRREKIRNTAKRFKLQTIISRYNTFQQYWQRICREIENGTYKRHVIRAERIAPGQMLTIAARKRLGKAALAAMDTESAPPPAPASVAPPPAPASVAPPSARPPAAESAPPPLPSPVPRPGMPSVLGKAPPKPGARPPPKPAAPGINPAPPAPAAGAAAPPGVGVVPAARPAAPAPPPARPPAPSALDLDLDFLGDWEPSAAPSKAKRAADVPAQPFGRALTQRLGAGPPSPSSAAPKPAPPARAPSPATQPKPAVPGSSAEQPLVAPAFVSPRPPPAPLPPAPRPAPPPRVAAAAPAATAPSAAAPPAAHAVGSASASNAKPLPAPLGAKALAAPIPTKSAAAPAIARPAAPPAAVKPQPPAAPKPTAPKPTAPTAAPPDERVRELHARLVEAKRQTQDASAVSMEGLAKSMKATEAKLREQHKNRKIDFDVVIKDGKAVLKPIVR